MYENRQINGYTHATRYIASWLKVGGQLRTGEDYDDFKEWLKSLELDERDVNHIYYLAINGKMELEYEAKMFLAKKISNE